MYLSVGNYTFATGVPSIAKAVSTEFSETGRPLSRTFTFTVSGTLYCTSQSDAAVQEAALEAALCVRSPNIILYQDDNSLSAVVLRGAFSRTGVKITGYRFPTTYGVECLTKRQYEFTAEATFGWGVNPDGTGSESNAPTLAVSWEESLDISGGEPLRDVFPAIKGPPQEQLIYEQTPWVAVQSGSATGLRAYPPFPPYLFPQNKLVSKQILRKTPKQEGLLFKDFSITWNYTFKSATVLDAYPTFFRSGF